jgi:hypothetical protein
LFQLVAIMGPLIALYYCSRRVEYSADREAISKGVFCPSAFGPPIGVHFSPFSPRCPKCQSYKLACHNNGCTWVIPT